MLGHVGAGEVAIHPHVRRTAKLHHDFALPLLIAPANDGRVDLLGPNPGLRRVRIGAAGRPLIFSPQVIPLPASKMPRAADHPAAGGCAGIHRRNRAHFVLRRVLASPRCMATTIAIRFVEHRLAVRCARRIRPCPSAS